MLPIDKLRAQALHIHCIRLANACSANEEVLAAYRHDDQTRLALARSARAILEQQANESEEASESRDPQWLSSWLKTAVKETPIVIYGTNTASKAAEDATPQPYNRQPYS